MSGFYHTAQICLNGHVISSWADRSNRLSKFCEDCGEKTINTCQSCGANIRGEYEMPNVVDLASRYSKPLFCYNCSHPFPWTERAQEAAYELVELTDNLSDEEKADLKNSLSDLLKNSPKTTIAEIKVKKHLTKAGSMIANGIKDVIIDVVSESVKKSIWG